MKCKLCGSSDIIFDEFHGELYCDACGCVIEYNILVSDGSEYNHTYHSRTQSEKKRYSKRKWAQRERKSKMFKKYLSLGGEPRLFERFLHYYLMKGIAIHNISRHMGKYIKEYR
jgi:transcription initiation factor TFIIIB Brf1 subunit/transcription initiation factor TFIIB